MGILDTVLFVEGAVKVSQVEFGIIGRLVERYRTFD
jgi:hypothetical protein